MSSPFELFFRLLQSIVQKRRIPCVQQAEIADIIWSRFIPDIKRQFKRDVKDFNDVYELRGKRKITPFWLFAQTLMQHLRDTDPTDLLLVDALFESLEPHHVKLFKSLEKEDSSKRHVIFMNILRCETSLRFI